jgi:ribosomal protein L40E
MGKRQTFALPELPPVCLKCGGRGPLVPAKVKYSCASPSIWTAVALLAGAVYYNETTYTLKLPMCGQCAGNGRRMILTMLLMWPAVIGLFALIYGLDFNYDSLYALPVVFAVAALVYTVVLQSRSRPKPVRVKEGLLVISVPGYGPLTLLGQDPKTPQRAAPAPRPRQDAGPRLNRSVCAGCGFINFAGAVECKKCRAPLGHAAAV